MSEGIINFSNLPTQSSHEGKFEVTPIPRLNRLSYII